MAPNVIIDEGRFRTTAAVKIGAILLHPDWPLGMAARDIEAGEIIEFSILKDTKDVARKMGIRPESIARQFTQFMENNYQAKAKFFAENYHKSIWLQCPSHDGEIIDFWQYGPPIPGADGYLYLSGEVWFNGRLEKWVACNIGTYLTQEEAKAAVEMKVENLWRVDANAP